MKENPSSIQQKLMRLVLVTIGTVLLLICAGFFTYEFYTFREASKQRLFTLGEIIAANSTAALAFQSAEDASEILNALKAERHIMAAALYDNKGNLLARYPNNIPKYKVPFRPAADGSDYVNGRLEGFQPVIQGEKRVGTLYLQSDIKAIYERFERYGLIALSVITISVVITYFLSKRLQTKISEPILALAKTARNISEKHDYTVRAKKFDNDELGILTDAFNQMLGEIERQNEEITAFSHALELMVTERTIDLENANIELKLKSEFEETIIDSSVDIIAVFDKELRYVILNRYGQRVFNVEKDDVTGKKVTDIFPQIKNSPFYEHLNRAFETGKFIQDPFYRSHISDRIIENFFIPLFDKNHEVYRVLVIGHDITEISETHEQLKQVNKELEKSNRDLEQFAFVASHDLQEPLRKIQTFSQLLEKKLDDREAAEKYLGKIISSAARMTDLIKAVLNYSRLSNEKGQYKSVDLNEVVANIRNDLELTINEKHAVIEAENLPAIDANPLQINQLFLNLISNSLKFCERKPEIKITSSVVDETRIEELDGLVKPGDYVELVFKDNGIGFEQQYAEKVFTVFQRLHGKQEYHGTGIGLALVKKIVTNHNGYITVNSKPREGSEFKVYIPLDRSAQQ